MMGRTWSFPTSFLLCAALLFSLSSQTDCTVSLLESHFSGETTNSLRARIRQYNVVASDEGIPTLQNDENPAKDPDIIVEGPLPTSTPEPFEPQGDDENNGDGPQKMPGDNDDESDGDSKFISATPDEEIVPSPSSTDNNIEKKNTKKNYSTKTGWQKKPPSQGPRRKAKRSKKNASSDWKNKEDGAGTADKKNGPSETTSGPKNPDVKPSSEPESPPYGQKKQKTPGPAGNGSKQSGNNPDPSPLVLNETPEASVEESVAPAVTAVSSPDADSPIDDTEVTMTPAENESESTSEYPETSMPASAQVPNSEDPDFTPQPSSFPSLEDDDNKESGSIPDKTPVLSSAPYFTPYPSKTESETELDASPSMSPLVSASVAPEPSQDLRADPSSEQNPSPVATPTEIVYTPDKNYRCISFSVKDFDGFEAFQESSIDGEFKLYKGSGIVQSPTLPNPYRHHIYGKTFTYHLNVSTNAPQHVVLGFAEVFPKACASGKNGLFRVFTVKVGQLFEMIDVMKAVGCGSLMQTVFENVKPKGKVIDLSLSAVSRSAMLSTVCFADSKVSEDTTGNSPLPSPSEGTEKNSPLPSPSEGIEKNETAKSSDDPASTNDPQSQCFHFGNTNISGFVDVAVPSEDGLLQIYNDPLASVKDISSSKLYNSHVYGSEFTAFIDFGDSLPRSLEIGFAEIYEPACKDDFRVFTVKTSSSSDTVDVYKQAGCNSPYLLVLDNVFPSSEGLYITFTSVKNFAMVSSICITGGPGEGNLTMTPSLSVLPGQPTGFKNLSGIGTPSPLPDESTAADSPSNASTTGNDDGEWGETPEPSSGTSLGQSENPEEGQDPQASEEESMPENTQSADATITQTTGGSPSPSQAPRDSPYPKVNGLIDATITESPYPEVTAPALQQSSPDDEGSDENGSVDAPDKSDLDESGDETGNAVDEESAPQTSDELLDSDFSQTTLGEDNGDGRSPSFQSLKPSPSPDPGASSVANWDGILPSASNVPDASPADESGNGHNPAESKPPYSSAPDPAVSSMSNWEGILSSPSGTPNVSSGDNDGGSQSPTVPEPSPSASESAPEPGTSSIANWEGLLPTPSATPVKLLGDGNGNDQKSVLAEPSDSSPPDSSAISNWEGILPSLSQTPNVTPTVSDPPSNDDGTLTNKQGDVTIEGSSPSPPSVTIEGSVPAPGPGTEENSVPSASPNSVTIEGPTSGTEGPTGSTGPSPSTSSEVVIEGSGPTASVAPIPTSSNEVPLSSSPEPSVPTAAPADPSPESTGTGVTQPIDTTTQPEASAVPPSPGTTEEGSDDQILPPTNSGSTETAIPQPSTDDPSATGAPDGIDILPPVDDPGGSPDDSDSDSNQTEASSPAPETTISQNQSIILPSASPGALPTRTPTPVTATGAPVATPSGIPGSTSTGIAAPDGSPVPDVVNNSPSQGPLQAAGASPSPSRASSAVGSGQVIVDSPTTAPSPEPAPSLAVGATGDGPVEVPDNTTEVIQVTGEASGADSGEEKPSILVGEYKELIATSPAGNGFSIGMGIFGALLVGLLLVCLFFAIFRSGGAAYSYSSGYSAHKPTDYDPSQGGYTDELGLATGYENDQPYGQNTQDSYGNEAETYDSRLGEQSAGIGFEMPAAGGLGAPASGYRNEEPEPVADYSNLNSQRGSQYETPVPAPTEYRRSGATVTEEMPPQQRASGGEVRYASQTRTENQYSANPEDYTFTGTFTMPQAEYSQSQQDREYDEYRDPGPGGTEGTHRASGNAPDSFHEYHSIARPMVNTSESSGNQERGMRGNNLPHESVREEKSRAIGNEPNSNRSMIEDVRSSLLDSEQPPSVMPMSPNPVIAQSPYEKQINVDVAQSDTGNVPEQNFSAAARNRSRQVVATSRIESREASHRDQADTDLSAPLFHRDRDEKMTGSKIAEAQASMRSIRPSVGTNDEPWPWWWSGDKVNRDKQQHGNAKVFVPIAAQYSGAARDTASRSPEKENSSLSSNSTTQIHSPEQTYLNHYGSLASHQPVDKTYLNHYGSLASHQPVDTELVESAQIQSFVPDSHWRRQYSSTSDEEEDPEVESSPYLDELRRRREPYVKSVATRLSTGPGSLSLSASDESVSLQARKQFEKIYSGGLTKSHDQQSASWMTREPLQV